MKALLIISHGSRSSQAVQEVAELARILKAKSHFTVIEHAFLDVVQPNIPAGIHACVRQGAGEIVVFPHFLNSGKHVLKDVPALIEAARKQYPDVCFKVMPAVGLHPQFAGFCLEMIKSV